MSAHSRYCAPCDDYTDTNPCEACGAETDRLPDELMERQKGDDDGREYADPRDYRDGLE